MKGSLLGVLIGACLILSTPAWGQQNLAEVRIYVFSPAGDPVKGAEVRLEKTYRSDADGYLAFFDVPGSHTYVVFWNQKAAAALKVTLRAGSPVEAVVTLKPDATVEEAVPDSGRPDAPAVKAAEPAKPVAKALVQGKASHFETGKPVAGATLIFRGLAIDAKTDAQGRYQAEVPVGKLTFSVIHPEFATQTKEDVEVPLAGLTVDWELTPSAYQMEAMQIVSTEDIQVLGGVSALTDETKNSGVVLNLIGSEQIAKSGDSDAAGALSRVTGLTVVGGKYVYVRGMGERYSSTYMNGGRLPSPELDRRVVPLDLFPTAVIESLAIQKTYSPDMYGDFSGGAVTIRTLGVPNDRFKRRLRGSWGLSLSFDPETLLQELSFQKTAPTDWLGIDDGGRQLPSGIDPAVYLKPADFSGGLSPEALTGLGRSFANSWAPVTKRLVPDLSTTFTLRDKYDLTKTEHLGWSTSLLYKHSMGTDTETNRKYSDAQGKNLSSDTKTTTKSQEVNWGGLANLEYEAERVLNLRSTTLFTRITNDDFSETTGTAPNLNDTRMFDASWIEQQLLNEMVSALWHGPAWLPIEVRGQYSFSLAGRYEPDHRILRYGQTEAGDAFDAKNNVGPPYRLFLGASDVVHDASLATTLPFPFLGQGSDTFTLGGQWIAQNRKVAQNRYTYDFGNSPHAADPIGTIFDPSHIDNTDSSAILFFENTKQSDSYQGTHSVLAGWASVDLMLFNVLRTNLGARVEQSDQILNTSQLGTFAVTPLKVVLSTLDVLPSANLTVPLGREFQAHLGVSRTVNRPDFIEISKTVKDGLPGEGGYQGNPDLKRAEIWNADARLEQYFNPTESWSIGGFYKSFSNPIEVTEVNGSTGIQTPMNIPAASNLGVELEWNVTLGGLADWLREAHRNQPSSSVESFFWDRQALGFWGGVLRDMTTTGNLSWIQSEISYGSQDKGNNTSVTRPLQGQSPWVINLGLGYKNSQSWSPTVRSDTGVTLSYNVFGPRIKKVGTGTLQDSYEQPFHQLDLVVKHRFDESWSLDLKVKNLLDPPATETRGTLVLAEQRKGRTLSLGVKYDF